MRQPGLASPEEPSTLAAAAPPGAEGLFCLPYFSPAGERAPFLNPHARGSLLGMSFEHGREHLARAIFEGLAYLIRDCLLVASGAGALPRRCVLSSGGANGALWCGIIADALGMPTFRLRDQEVGAKGAMIVGLVATGAKKNFATAAQDYLEVRDTFEPDAGRHAHYREWFEQFLAVRGHALSV